MSLPIDPRGRSWYRCGAGCPGRYDLAEVMYACPRCGDLLLVEHAMGPLRRRTARGWKRLFDGRLSVGTGWPASGVWSKREWVCPRVAPENIVTLGEGRTPLVEAPEHAAALGVHRLWIKECGTSHTGSFKDLGMTVLVSMVRQMRAEGVPVRAVACASTGDTSAALAAYGAAAGVPVIVFLPRGKVSTAQLLQPLAHGATTLALDTDFDGCMALVRRICAEEGIYLANSMNSLRIEGQKTVGIEVVQQLGWDLPDWFVVPGGNLGNVTALVKGLRQMKDLGLIDRLPRVACAQAARANPLYRAYRTGFRKYRSVRAGATAASAIRIGDPVSFRRAVDALRACRGVVEQATEDELAHAAALANRAGLFACPHTGVALAALAKLVRRKVISRRARVVVISTAHGLKFHEFLGAYQEGRLPGARSRLRNRPLELPADPASVRAALRRLPWSSA